MSSSIPYIQGSSFPYIATSITSQGAEWGERFLYIPATVTSGLSSESGFALDSASKTSSVYEPSNSPTTTPSVSGRFRYTNSIGSSFSATPTVPSGCEFFAWRAVVRHSGSTLVWIVGPNTGRPAADGASAWSVNASGVMTSTTYQGLSYSGYSATDWVAFARKFVVDCRHNDGTTARTVLYGVSTLPSISRQGYILEGWYTASTDGTRVGGAGDTYTPTASIMLYAHWVAAYTITYDANGGTVSPTSDVVVAGNSITLPTPQWAAHTFNGWYTEEEGGTRVGSAGDTYYPSGDIILYAQWTEIPTYTISFDANGGTGAPSSISVISGDSWTCPATTPTKANATFTGWSSSSSATYPNIEYYPGSTYSSPSSSMILYAVWVDEIGVLIYNPEGGIVDVTYKTVVVGSAYGTLPAPTKTGYTFDGWFTSASGGVQVTSSTVMQSAGNTVIYARWSLPTSIVYVYFNPNGGSPTPSARQVAQGQPIGELPTVTLQGSAFVAWKNSTTGATLASSTIMGDTDIYAIAEWSRTYSTTTFDPNGGAVAQQTMTVFSREPYGRLPIPRRNGYNFLGWFTQDDTQVLPSDTPASSATLIAHWDDGTVAWFRARKTVADDQAL